MSGDKRAAGTARRHLERARVGWPSTLRELKDLLYEAYLAAGGPTLDDIAEDIAARTELPGSPGRDRVWRCISEATVPSKQADAVAVAAVLARRAAWSEEELAARVRELWVAAHMATPAGQPIAGFDDRRVLKDLEVHRAIDAGAAVARGLGALPAYVPRAFDARLEAAVAKAKQSSTIVVLVGGSSTGKTRACWEAARTLPAGWRAWHPIHPTPAGAALAELDDIAPRTVVWLNEAQSYLASAQIGDQVAAGLRNLLRTPERGPILVLATLWPEHWNTLTARPSEGASDPHAQARELLDGTTIEVPDSFTGADRTALAETAGADPRIAEAAARAEDGQITQYLAGVPVLMNRYRVAPPATKALIHAAMDARRLGTGPLLPLALLAEAAPGYLNDTEWNRAQGASDWLAQALDYLTTPCNGIPGILTPVSASAPRNRRADRDARHLSRAGQGPLYQLSDYLHQYGRRHRADQIPPIDFWAAAATHAHPDDLEVLGDAAWDRGLYRDSAQIHKVAIENGNPNAAPSLVRHLHGLFPDDHRPALASAANASVDKQHAVSYLLGELTRIGAVGQAVALAGRAAADFPLHDRHVVKLLESLDKFGADRQVTVLAERVASGVPLRDPAVIASLLEALPKVGEAAQVATLLARGPAHHVSLDNPFDASTLLKTLHKFGADRQVTVLAERVASGVPLRDPNAIASLLEALPKVGEAAQVATLLARDPASQIVIDTTPVGPSEPGHLDWLLTMLRKLDAVEQASILVGRVAATRVTRGEVVRLGGDRADHLVLHDPEAVGYLLRNLRDLGAQEQVAALLARNPAGHVTLHDPKAIGGLLWVLRNVGADGQVAALAERAAPRVPLDDLDVLGRLLRTLRGVEADAQVIPLAERAADHVPVNRPAAVVRLMKTLRDVEADAQVVPLAERAVAHAVSHDPDAVAGLLRTLRRVMADAQVIPLAEWAAARVPPGSRTAVARLLKTLRNERAMPLFADPAAARLSLIEMDERAARRNVLNGDQDARQMRPAAELPAADVWPATDRARFETFLQIGNHRERFRFGREPDGSPADPWAWQDLE
jgi:hypothetical protein